MEDSTAVPLFVDLDNCLIQTNILHELVALLVRERPMSAARIPLWLLKGRRILKHRLAELCAPNVELLPYNEPLIEFIHQESERRRPNAFWVVCIAVLYWITRIWFLAARAELPEDPLVFALRDRVSYAVALICAAAAAVVATL